MITYAECIVSALAACDPVATDYPSGWRYCALCGAGTYDRSAPQSHEDDCPWLRARTHVGLG